MNASLIVPSPGRPNRAARRAALLVAAALIAWGGLAYPRAAAAQAAKAPAPNPFTALVPRETELAKQEEEAGNLRSAAYHWDMVADLSSGDAKTRSQAKAAALRKDAQSRADQLFKEGMAAYEKNQVGPAFRALLRSLVYDPSNQVALRKLKDELIGTSVIPYTVVQGDTFASIAEKNKFEDPSLAWVIGMYNDIGEKALKPGQTIRVPLMIGVLWRPGATAKRGGAPAEQDDVEYDSGRETIAQARDLLKSSKFEEASKLAAKVLADDPVNKDAKDVSNASNYAIGKRLQQEKKYEAALTAYAHVELGYLDTRQVVTAMRSQGAEDHYSNGVKYFVNDDLDNAIKEFEATLALNPNHPQAAKDLQQARDTRDKLRKLK